MTTPAIVEQDPLEQLKALKASQVGAADDPLEQLKSMKATVPLGHDFHAEYASGKLGKRMASENVHEDAPEAPDQASYGQRALGGIASLGHAIPGVEAAQAGARAIIRRQPYRQALSDIQQGEASSGGVGKFNSLLGGTIAAMAVPSDRALSLPEAMGGRAILRGPALQGAQFGIASALGSSNPDEDLKARIDNSAVKGALGAATAKAIDVGGSLVRGMGAKPVGDAQMPFRKAIAESDASLYPTAEAEGNALAGQPIPIKLADALNAPDVAPVAHTIANSRSFNTVNDQGLPRAARLLRETYKALSAQQGDLQAKIDAGNGDVAIRQSLRDIGLAKNQLLDAADPVMPTLRKAIEGHAETAGNLDAFNTGADQTKIVAKGGFKGAARKAAQKGGVAFQQAIEEANPAQAQAMRAGATSRLGEQIGLTPNPLTAFGTVPSLNRAANTAPFLNALDRAARPGSPSLTEMLRALGISQVSQP